MEKSFSFTKYVSELGIDLIREFNKAKMSTQSVAVGNNKEQSLINKLEELLPKGVGIGSGFVFDAFGNVSHQCDIVIYEKDFCLKPCINKNTKDVFYNCESVIAVGEVKTSLTSKELKDCLTKFSSLNSLSRYIDNNNLSTNRQYLSKMSIQHNFDNKPLERGEFDRIYKFILCEKIQISLKKIKECVERFVVQKDECFNTIVSLDNKHVLLLNNNKLCLSPYFATTIIMQKDKNEYSPFLRFMYHLTSFVFKGTTVPLNQGKYYEISRENINNYVSEKLIVKGNK